MDLDTAIRRLSFAEARRSAGEALLGLARHRAEVLDAVAAGRSEAERLDMADRAREESAHRRVDRSA